MNDNRPQPPMRPRPDGQRPPGIPRPPRSGQHRAAFNGMTRLIPFIQRIIPTLDSITAGVIIYNLPLYLFKYFVCGIITSLIYSYVYEFTNRE